MIEKEGFDYGLNGQLSIQIIELRIDGDLMTLARLFFTDQNI